MKTKRYAPVCLTLCLLLLLSACAGNTSPSEEPTPEVVSPSVELLPWDPPSPKASENPSPAANLAVEIPVPDVSQKDIPDNEAIRFVKDMKIGWNLGNTLDAHASYYNGPEEDYETVWCGIKTTQEMIDAVKAAGFNTIRIPVTWNPHVDEDYNISEVWLNRVQEVVDYAWTNDMFVILNIHHDTDKAFVYPDSEHYEQSSRFVKRIWEQVAERFKDYDERLIFEGLNEPRLIGTNYEWWQDMNNDVCKDSLETLCRLQQDFTDTVRAAGGYNETRYLMVCGLAANTDTVTHSLYKLPSDTADNRLIISIHAYTPYNFALQGQNENGSVSDFDMTQSSSTRDIDSFMDKAYNTYVSRGIPVVIGEFGARDKDGNLRDRTEFAAYYVASARARGMTCVWWDNHGISGGGELFALLDRTSSSWLYPDIVTAMMMYS